MIKSILMLSLALVPMSRAAETDAAAGIDGKWMGRYSYAKRPAASEKPAKKPVPFEMELTASGDGFTAVITEPNTFGDKTSTSLRATAEGSVKPDGTVEFVKTYDGTGGVSHEVRYSGAMKREGGHLIVRGYWTVGKTSGEFKMYKKDGAAAKTHEK